MNRKAYYYEALERINTPQDMAENGFDYHGFDPKAIDELRMAVVKRAYEDLIEVRLLDAALRFRDGSYNLTMYYQRLNKRRTLPDTLYAHGTLNRGKKLEDMQKDVLVEINKLERWFLNSPRCRDFLNKANPEFFVEQAKRRVMDFCLDKIMHDDLAVNTGIKTSDTTNYRNDKREKWKRERDKWRREHNLSKVEDDG